MATRLYFSSTVPPISPAFDAAWDVSGLAIRRLGSLLAADAAQTAVVSFGSGSANDDTLCYQLVYGPLAPQLITGTLKGQFFCREASAAADARGQCGARIVSADGSTVRGTLLALDANALTTPAGSEFAVAATGPAAVNRKIPRGGAVALSSVAAQAGDWWVGEVGFRQHGTDTGVIRIALGAQPGTDAPEDESTVIGSAYFGWLELSQTLILAPGPRAFASVV